MTPASLIKTVTDQRNKRLDRATRATGTILNQVAERHRYLIASMDAKEMWNTLKTRFQDLSPMSATDILFKIFKKIMANFTDASNYCSAYESALDRISGMISDKSILNAKAAETVVQGFMLANVNESYAPTVAQLRRDWTEGEIDLSKTSKAIVTYSGNMREKAKALYKTSSLL